MLKYILREVCLKARKGQAMASKTETYYPPYMGAEPYIHLCFSDRDERKVRPLLRRLLLRGCRTWYWVGYSRDRTSESARNRRMLGAGLTVLFLTDNARRDTELKNQLLVCQKEKQPILVLNTDGGDSGLSLGLTGKFSSVTPGTNASELVNAIFHSPDFSQLYLGDPLPVFDRLRLRRISVLLVVLALLLAGGAGVYRYLNPPASPAQEETALPEDTVAFQDETLRAAVRSAVGGGPITEEAVAELESLYLSQLPEYPEELALLPHLATLILSEAAAQGAPEQPELYNGYTLIVRGGDGQ